MSRSWRGTIPIYINNRNWLTTTRGLVEYFASIPGTEVIIVDNASTYQPLLQWYEQDCRCKVIRLLQNHGCHAPWNSGAVLSKPMHRAWFGSDYYLLTDSDLNLDHCPRDLVQVLVEGYEKYADVTKVGTSLEIADLPQDSLSGFDAATWESGFWQNRRDDRFFNADVDTTLALYGTGVQCIGSCLRTDRPYTARHMPWYLTEATMDDESRYYLRYASGGSWTTHLQEKLGINCPSPESTLSTDVDASIVEPSLEAISPFAAATEKCLQALLRAYRPRSILESGTFSGSQLLAHYRRDTVGAELTRQEPHSAIAGLSGNESPYDLIILTNESVTFSSLGRDRLRELCQRSNSQTTWVLAAEHGANDATITGIKKWHGTGHFLDVGWQGEPAGPILRLLLPRHLTPDPAHVVTGLPESMRIL